MKKVIVIVSLVIVVLLAVVISIHIDEKSEVETEPRYESKQEAIDEELKYVIEEWAEINLGRMPENWTIDSENIVAQYTHENEEYYVAYIDCVDDTSDYLDFFIIKVISNEGTFSAERVSAFYGLIQDNSKEQEDTESAIVGGDVAVNSNGVKIKFSCAKIKGEDELFLDGVKVPEEHLEKSNH